MDSTKLNSVVLQFICIGKNWHISGSLQFKPVSFKGQLYIRNSYSACFSSTYTKTGMIQRRLAWPLHKDDMQIREVLHIFTIVQSYSNQSSMVLVQKQAYRSMEQNRESRNKPTHLQSINLRQQRQEYKMGKRQSLQQVVLGKLDSCM